MNILFWPCYAICMPGMCMCVFVWKSWLEDRKGMVFPFKDVRSAFFYPAYFKSFSGFLFGLFCALNWILVWRSPLDPLNSETVSAVQNTTMSLAKLKLKGIAMRTLNGHCFSALYFSRQNSGTMLSLSLFSPSLSTAFERLLYHLSLSLYFWPEALACFCSQSKSETFFCDILPHLLLL